MGDAGVEIVERAIEPLQLGDQRRIDGLAAELAIAGSRG
jgi:hypothetical protein